MDCATPIQVGSFSAASNVTGIVTDVTAVTKILHRHGALGLVACMLAHLPFAMLPSCVHPLLRTCRSVPGRTGIWRAAFFDYAAAGAYLDINMGAGGLTIDSVLVHFPLLTTDRMRAAR